MPLLCTSLYGVISAGDATGSGSHQDAFPPEPLCLTASLKHLEAISMIQSLPKIFSMNHMKQLSQMVFFNIFQTYPRFQVVIATN